MEARSADRAKPKAILILLSINRNGEKTYISLWFSSSGRFSQSAMGKKDYFCMNSVPNHVRKLSKKLHYTLSRENTSSSKIH